MSVQKSLGQNVLDWIFKTRLRSRVIMGFGIGVIVSFLTKFLNEQRKKLVSRSRLYEMVPSLKRDNVFIKDWERVESILTEIIKGGKERLFIVSDFDGSVSRYYDNGEVLPSSFGFFVHSPLLTLNEKRQWWALFHLLLFFRTPTPAATKLENTTKFVTRIYDLIGSASFTRSELQQALENNRLLMRTNTDYFFAYIHSQNIPLYIYSAGLEDIISYVINNNYEFPKNVYILANKLLFDENSKIQKIREPRIIHCKKDSKLLSDFEPFKERCLQRHNAILLSDSISDTQMLDGISTVQNVLKIGFLNDFENSPELPDYMQHYDIVLTYESSLDVINGIITRLL